MYVMKKGFQIHRNTVIRPDSFLYPKYLNLSTMFSFHGLIINMMPDRHSYTGIAIRDVSAQFQSG